jgi:prephenate dehydratase
MEITTLGPNGTYASQVAKKIFPKNSINFEPTILDVLESDGIKVVPLENSIEGTVRISWDSILEKKLWLCGICKLEIDHVLASRAGSLKSIKTVFSHQQALAQCRKFVRKFLKKAKVIHVSSTAEAAMIALSDPAAAAIVSPHACEIYGLEILKKDIEDEKDNVTIFGVVADKDIFLKLKKDEMHIVVTPKKNMPGLLFNILKPFHDYKVDLTRLESRPTRKKIGEYRFLLSFKIDNGEYKKVLKILKNRYKVDILGESVSLKI